MRHTRFEDKVRRALHYALYDWTREMPRPKRVVTWAGILIQGYAIYGGFARTLVWPRMWPTGGYLYLAVFLLYFFGYMLMNGMLTSEFVRKTQLESDQIAARKIQQTLIPQTVPALPGYQVETYYKPFKEVGGDYFDVLELPGGRTLLVLADVSGKGVSAALLAANIQALVRSIASLDQDPLIFAKQINSYLSRYAPPGRFATALFLMLTRESGELTYVNAGHNSAIVSGPESITLLEATGMPLGLFAEAVYETGRAVVHNGDSLLLFTDGLPDSIPGSDPERLMQKALTERPESTMSNLISLISLDLNEDDVTVLLLKRDAMASQGVDLSR
ncbi:MAG: SpoIIE family protein phosphatase [Terracidiphilus sp.]|jgi:serine phosphatase RsbU (regulator of sigma subunit)